MKIPKSYLIKFGISGVLLVFLSGIVLFFLSQNTYHEKIRCNSQTILYSYKKCGYISSSPNNKFHKIVGVVKSKESQGNDKIINLITHSSSGSSILLPVFIYPDPIPKNLTIITPDDEIKISSIAATTQPSISSDSFFDSLNVNEEIIVNVFTPDTNDLTQAKNAYGNLKALNCHRYQGLMIKYLSDSSFINNTNAQINKLISGCNLYTLQVEKIKT